MGVCIRLLDIVRVAFHESPVPGGRRQGMRGGECRPGGGCFLQTCGMTGLGRFTMAWFSKILGGAKGKTPDTPERPPLRFDEEIPRRVVNAPVLDDMLPFPPGEEKLLILAQLDEKSRLVRLWANRTMLEDGWSWFCPDRHAAYACAPLAGALFDGCGTVSVLINANCITIGLAPGEDGSVWESARAAGSIIRNHLDSGRLVVLPEVLASVPAEEEISHAVSAVLEREVNPAIAAHNGFITLERVQKNTVYLTMGGGCQGCAASALTLRSGVEKTLRAAVPEIGAIIDTTDHTAGFNPWFRALPPEMKA